MWLGFCCLLLVRIASNANSARCGLLLRIFFLSVCLSVCVGHTRDPCKTAEPIEMPFGRQTRKRLRNHLLDVGTFERHLANTTERSVLVADERTVATVTVATCIRRPLLLN